MDQPSSATVSSSAAASPDVLFCKLTDVVRRELGGFVSSKIARAGPPLLPVPGLVARQPIAALEQLLRVPASLHLTRRLVREMGPDFDALRPASAKLRVDGVEVAAFVAAKLQALELLGQRRCSEDLHKEHEERDAWCNASSLDLLLGMQLWEDFTHMPVRFMVCDEGAKHHLMPSPEVYTAECLVEALRDAHEFVVQNLPAEVLSSNPISLDRFVQAHLILRTRAFSWSAAADPFLVHRIVPLADMLNHSSTPNASWDFNDAGDLVVKAVSNIEAGGELFITYGSDKSNAQLFRNYGFTVDAQLEHTWSIRSRRLL